MLGLVTVIGGPFALLYWFIFIQWEPRTGTTTPRPTPTQSHVVSLMVGLTNRRTLEPGKNPMTEPTYDSIKHLIDSEEQTGSTMKCVFKCESTGTTVASSASISKGRGIKNVAKSAAKQSLFSSLRRAVASVLSSTLGHGVAGKVASQVSREMLSNTNKAMTYSSDDKQAAVVRAFENVAASFRFDPEQSRWLGVPAGAATETGFSKQLEQHPVSERYDQGILARMLVEIACADGTVSDDEREFLGGFIDEELGTIDDLTNREKLSTVELEEVSAGAARETMLMIAWTAALSDEGLADTEKARLDELAAGLGVAADRASEVQSLASSYLLEQALGAAYPGGKRDEQAHGEAMTYGASLGIGSEDIQRADIRYRKRMGIV